MKKFDHDVQDLLVGLAAAGGNQLAALQRKFPSIQGTEDHINLPDYFEYLETEGFSTVKDQISSKAFNEFRLSFITLKKEFITSFRKLEVHLLLGKKYTLIICLLSLFTDYAA